MNPEEDKKQETEDLDELLSMLENRLPTGRRKGSISGINGECRVGRSRLNQAIKHNLIRKTVIHELGSIWKF